MRRERTHLIMAREHLSTAQFCYESKLYGASLYWIRKAALAMGVTAHKYSLEGMLEALTKKLSTLEEEP